MVNDKVLVVLEAKEGLATKEDLMQSEGFKSPHTVIITLDDLRKNKSLMLGYKGLLDCTIGHRIVNALLDADRIRKMEDSTGVFYASVKGTYMRTAPNTEELFVLKGYETAFLIQRSKENIIKYKKELNELFKKCPKIANKIKLNDGLKSEIDVTDFFPRDNSKRFKLVTKIPTKKEDNVEYITPLGSEITERLLRIKKETE